VVVVTHDHAEDLSACLSSLGAAMARVEAELILIDNCSSDASFEIACASAPQPSTLIRNESRRGFSTNANEGIRRSSADAILTLNPDTVIDEAAIAELLTYMRSHPRAGVLAPALYFPDGRLQPSRRRFPTLSSTIVRRTPLRRWLRDSDSNRKHLMLDEEIAGPQRIDWALGACLMLNRAALDDVGIFDERYPLYVEDIDLCYRMHQSGWHVVYVPGARVTHRHLAVTDQRWLTPRTFAHFRGMLRFVRKHGLRGR
jgi:GT2 family glycosyltransferase